MCVEVCMQPVTIRGYLISLHIEPKEVNVCTCYCKVFLSNIYVFKFPLPKFSVTMLDFGMTLPQWVSELQCCLI